MPLSRRITDHQEIRQWAASCQAIPVEVSPGVEGSQFPTVRFMFLDGSPNQPELTPIFWEDFFEKFDFQGLVLACEENVTGGLSKSYELLRPE